MSRKIYNPPSAELIYLVPQEEITAGWNWGVFDSNKASVNTIGPVDVWSPFEFEQDNDSYTITKK